MRRRSRTAVIVAALALIAPPLAAQELRALAGVWTVVDAAAARHGGGFPEELDIDVSGPAITIRTYGDKSETYILNDAPTRLIDGRSGAATLEGGALVLTFRRERTRDGELFVTVRRDVYRRSGDTLTVERLARGERPGQTPPPWAAVHTLVYRIARQP